jgi:sortase (surface protein transpeptidase)
MNGLVDTNQSTGFKRYSLIGVALIAVLFLVYFFQLQPALNKSADALIQRVIPDSNPVLLMTASQPRRIAVPALEINASMVELGLKRDQTIEVPKKGEDVGWYKHSPTPGELGPAILVGHLDWYNGPAVFFNLGRLTKGDLIRIERADGTVAVFEVVGKEIYPQDNFGTEQVYGPIDHAGLRLITCTGNFLKKEGHYTDNLVVYADLVSYE